MANENCTHIKNLNFYKFRLTGRGGRMYVSTYLSWSRITRPLI